MATPEQEKRAEEELKKADKNLKAEKKADGRDNAKSELTKKKNK